MGSALAEIDEHLPDYVYVGVSTALAFGLFGHIMGRHADRLAELSETDPMDGTVQRPAIVRQSGR